MKRHNPMLVTVETWGVPALLSLVVCVLRNTLEHGFCATYLGDGFAAGEFC